METSVLHTCFLRLCYTQWGHLRSNLTSFLSIRVLPPQSFSWRRLPFLITFIIICIVSSWTGTLNESHILCSNLLSSTLEGFVLIHFLFLISCLWSATSSISTKIYLTTWARFFTFSETPDAACASFMAAWGLQPPFWTIQKATSTFVTI